MSRVSEIETHLVSLGFPIPNKLTDVESYDELGRLQATVGLVESWVTTRAELVRLCIALGVESWKKALA
jgi:hypothetical protein